MYVPDRESSSMVCRWQKCHVVGIDKVVMSPIGILEIKKESIYSQQVTSQDTLNWLFSVNCHELKSDKMAAL